MLNGYGRTRFRGTLRMALAFWIFFIAMAFSPVAAVAAQGKGEGSAGRDEIRGKMTLAEIAQNHQVPASYLIERLKLPPNTSLNESLRTIQERRHFEMDDLRAFLLEYRSGKGLAILGGGLRRRISGKETTSPRRAARNVPSRGTGIATN